MPHSPEGLAFLTRLNTLPDGPGVHVNLDDILKPSLDDEQELRQLFAQDGTNSRVQSPHVGLVEVFGDNTDALRKTRARVVDYNSEESLSSKYIIALKESQRRKESEASMVADLEQFKRNWAIFTEGSLSQLVDWNNVIAAGGSVLSALLPLSAENKKSKRAIRKYYHSIAFPSSDVDLFLWGLTPEQAERKIVAIYEAVRDSVPWDVTCIRTKHTISIHSQYPYRSVQIVLRLYKSPAEVLAGFDIDAPCCAYDGERVWANPRALMAMIRQCNTVDVTRRSPSYESRLAKYARRGFEIYVPTLNRQDIDPTIYERSIVKIHGLARLLVFEKLQDIDSRYNFLESRRELRGRPYILRRPASRKKRKYRGDLKTDSGIGGLEMNNYDVTSLHIPYGPSWDAKRIDKLVYQTDLGMNSTFNPKNKGRRLHRHPAFFGTVEECMEDCCEHCPEPIDDDERKLQEEEETYIHGRISFIEDNPGCQTLLSGSFNPIDEGEWSEQVYIKPLQKLFNAIASHDISLVRSILLENKSNSLTTSNVSTSNNTTVKDTTSNDADNRNAISLQHRDHVGRTALHLAILVQDTEIAKLLIDEGCRMIARMVDGRTALHMAAQYGLDEVINKMYEKSRENKGEVERKERESGKLKDDSADEDEEMKDGTTPPPETTTTETEPGRPSSEDDWSSDENDGKDADASMDVDDEEGDNSDEGEDEEEYDDCEDEDSSDPAKKKKQQEDQPPPNPEDEDNVEEPDILDIDAGDWDQGFTPLCYAVFYSPTPSTVSILLSHGADPNKATSPSNGNTWATTRSIPPLYLSLVRSSSSADHDEDLTISIAERLIDAGATISTASDDDGLMTVLHYAVVAQKPRLLDLFLRKDKNGARAALDFPSVTYAQSRFPVASAIARGAYASLLTLLAHGGKVNPGGSDILRAKAISSSSDTRIWGYSNVEDYATMIYTPVETAIASGDYIVDLLLEIGGDVNIGTFESRGQYCLPENKKTVLDWVVDALDNELPQKIKYYEKERDELDEKAKKQTYSTTASTKSLNTWKEYLDEFYARHAITANEKVAKQTEDEQKTNTKQLTKFGRIREFLQHVRASLDSAGAKSWYELHPPSENDENNTDRPKMLGGIRAASGAEDQKDNKPKPRYMLLGSRYSGNWVPHEQNERYDKLFEAAFRGDDAKIEELCVPQAVGDGADNVAGSVALPVQVTVEAVVPGGSDYAWSKKSHDRLAMRTGLTPLHAAFAGKRWNTAKFIMGVAAAQYKNEKEDEEDEVQAALFNLVDEEEEEDMNDGDSTYSDVTVEPPKRQTKFVDIAKKILIRTDIHPSQLLTTTPCWVFNQWQEIDKASLPKAVEDNNFEAFTHLLSIQELTRTKEAPKDDMSILKAIFEADAPKFLDELIRRTGTGIDIDTVRQTPTEDQPVALVNDESRLYLGLNIHGKKRADLARKGDPNASQSNDKSPPLLWSAIADGAKLIVEYLASEKPIAAYKYFATHGKGARAEWFVRRLKSLETSLSDWLGWHVSEVGESPLAVAVLKDQKEMLPLLFTKNAKLMGSVLHTSVKPMGFNLLLLAANKGCSKEVFEFLLKKGVSPLEVDGLDRWNIYHWLCSLNRHELFKYLLEYLPRESSGHLLAGRTKEMGCLPLHMAVKNGCLRLTDTMLKFTQDNLFEYDARGFTPLHYAIKQGYAGITEALLKVIPRDGLYLENGVGKTPYEDAEKRAMEPTTTNLHVNNPLGLNNCAIIETEGDVGTMEKELHAVIETMKRLTGNGTLEKGSTLSNAFEKFVSASEGRLAKLKAQEEVAKAEDAKEQSSDDDGSRDIMVPIRTLDVIARAVGPNTVKRTLVHLKDVQKSVGIELARINQVEEQPSNRDGLEDEVDKEDEVKGMVIDNLERAVNLW